jgi:uncharacterized 2Fe-2S/4Fe-4S cluster protein (DUF4445 family)
LSRAEIELGMRLACLAEIRGPVRIEIGHAPERETERRPTVTAARPILAVDLGTTTIEVALAEAAAGDFVIRNVADNPQASYGADVMSRIASAGDGHLEEMRRLTAQTVGELVSELLDRAGVDGAVPVTVAGNPTMLHILAGEDPAGMGTAPYEAAFQGRRELAPEAIDAPDRVASVTLLPAIAPFVGADVVAGIVATRLLTHPGTALLIDVGTNGEVVLKRKDGTMWAASAAAGPAFEGGGIEYGMRADEGAIERVTLHGSQLCGTVLGKGPARGICGSGLFDLIAVMLDAGVLDSEGRIQASGPLSDAVVKRDGVAALEVTEHVLLTQQDVRAFQLAKGAVTTAVRLLLEEAGVMPGQVDDVLIAGGFGLHLDPFAARRVGLLQDGWEIKTIFVGNTSLAGAALLGSDARVDADVDALVEDVRVLDLAQDPRFQETFVRSLDFPS